MCPFPPISPTLACGDSQTYNFPSGSQIHPIRRFTTEADIHHATPLMLDAPGHAPSLAAPPYRAPPHPAPAHLYHPRDRLPRPGPLLPPVDEDEYVPLEDKEQDLHRQLLNLPVLQSDGGSHDSHNDSGYSTRLGFCSNFIFNRPRALEASQKALALEPLSQAASPAIALSH